MLKFRKDSTNQVIFVNFLIDSIGNAFIGSDDGTDDCDNYLHLTALNIARGSIGGCSQCRAQGKSSSEDNGEDREFHGESCELLCG